MKYQVVRGNEIPKEAKWLTRGQDGVMLTWYERDRDRMHATLLYRKGKLIGWCAVVRVKLWGFNTRKFEISTFVQKNLRGRGYAKNLVEHTLKFVKTVEPRATILYGTPDDHEYFNPFYIKTINSIELKPRRYFAAPEKKHA